jgi:phenylacetate-CoA ligase
MISGTGRVISMTAINMHSPVFDNVSQFRFAQRNAGHVVLRIVPRASYEPQRDEQRIRAELGPKLGADTTLELVLVDELRRSASGKVSFIDQELPSPFGAPS